MGETDETGAEFAITIPVSVQAERRQPVTRWGAVQTVPVGVSLGHMPREEGVLLVAGERASRHHAGNTAIVLHRKETEGVVANLSSRDPCLYVVMRPDAEAPLGARVHLVSASDYQAQDHTDAGEDEVERVPLPPELREPIEAFVARHHVEEPFYKRKRRADRPEEHKFGQRPIFEPGSRPDERTEKGGPQATGERP